MTAWKHDEKFKSEFIKLEKLQDVDMFLPFLPHPKNCSPIALNRSQASANTCDKIHCSHSWIQQFLAQTLRIPWGGFLSSTPLKRHTGIVL